MRLDRRTEKLYYRDSHLGRNRARVVRIGPDHVETDATVAFPEGGGQEADTGTLHGADGRVLRFVWAKKMYAHSSGLPEFPDVQVEGVIWHMIDPQDLPLLQGLQVGSEVDVAIDVERRARLTLSHTASHLLYLAVARHRPDAVRATIGCHIKPDGARFDFAVEARFSAEEVALIEHSANELVARDLPVTTSAHPAAEDARLWHCDQQVIPCGGTHLDRTGPVGPMQVRRRGLGTGKERLSCTFGQATFDFGRYRA